MPRPVKPTRRYDSPRRREQAASTRLEILEAARRLFERDGYAATTMATIAAEARVALKTVYVAFETKSGVLRALWNLTLRGEDGEDGPSLSARGTAKSWRSPTPSDNCALMRGIPRGKGPRRCARGSDSQRSPDRSRHRRALGSDRNRLPRKPADDRGQPERKGRVAPQPRRGARGGHPLGAEPSQRLAATRLRSRLDPDQYEQCAETSPATSS